MEESNKEVRFDLYCKTCRYYELAESEDPCYECLENPVNCYSHKPVNWEEKQLIIKKGDTCNVRNNY